jgi:transcriptional regulator with XRE-family HTH domain
MISAVIELCAEDREPGAELMITGVLLRLRLRREWTQELLSTHSGISVRTIRNLESGRIRNPRRSTVDLLLAVLDPDHRQAANHHQAAPAHYPAQPSPPREMAVMTRPSRTSHRPVS